MQEAKEGVVDLSNVADPKDLLGKHVNGYIMLSHIGSGSFGHVFEAEDTKTKTHVAIKVPVKNDARDGQNSLIEEAKIYKVLSHPPKGIPNVRVSKYRDRKLIVMDLLGSSLETLLGKHKRFGLKTVIQLAVKMIDTMRFVHSFGYLHRDIKPDNYVIGRDDPRDLYCIDFGLAKKYIKSNGDHIDFLENRKFVGTARYASINAHRGVEQSRRDDMESIGYLLVYFFKGKLPWQGVKHKDKKERYRLIHRRKEEVSTEELCSSMPREFVTYLNYVKNLDFDEKPHYTALKNMFTKLYDSRGYSNNELEWEKNETRKT